MNTLNYIQFFDGLAEKNLGAFRMEKLSSKTVAANASGHTHICNLEIESNCFSAWGNSRKEALKGLYKQLGSFK